MSDLLAGGRSYVGVVNIKQVRDATPKTHPHVARNTIYLYCTHFHYLAETKGICPLKR